MPPPALRLQSAEGILSVLAAWGLYLTGVQLQGYAWG